MWRWTVFALSICGIGIRTLSCTPTTMRLFVLPILASELLFSSDSAVLVHTPVFYQHTDQPHIAGSGCLLHWSYRFAENKCCRHADDTEDDGQEIFLWSSCQLDLGTDFLIGNMVFVWDAEYLVVAPHVHGLYSSVFFDTVQPSVVKLSMFIHRETELSSSFSSSMHAKSLLRTPSLLGLIYEMNLSIN